jgi:protein ImuA
MALAESGTLYGPGLEEAGLAPERLVTVAAARERELLWAMEEALRCRSVGAVIGETRSTLIDAVATRRLALAAADSGALALLMRTAPMGEPSAAATRWVVGAAPSSPSSERGEALRPTATRFASQTDLPLPGGGERLGLGPPRLTVHLVRNRRGHLGSWTLEWNRECFVLATHPELVAATAVHRPPRAHVA